MKERRINLDYLNLYQEIPLFCALIAASLFRAKPRAPTGRILIVNTCLIGEFAASLPAIRDYIERHEGAAVDLVVSPPLKPLAERVRGVHTVYTARSLYGRQDEKAACAREKLPAYDTVFVMRISKDAFSLVRRVAAGWVRTGLREYAGYALHLWGSLLTRRPPKQWRELNFKMLGGTLRAVPFENIFDLTPSDWAALKRLTALDTPDKKVIIHTDASWPMKKWSLDRWVEFIRRAHGLGALRFIFVGGAGAAGDYEYIASRVDTPVYSLINQVNLFELLLVLRTSDYFIGVDSGPRNLAHLAGTPTVAIFGPGPHFYMPWSAGDAVIDKSRGRGLLQMFFATKRGFIHQITANEVYDAFRGILTA